MMAPARCLLARILTSNENTLGSRYINTRPTPVLNWVVLFSKLRAWRFLPRLILASKMKFDICSHTAPRVLITFEKDDEAPRGISDGSHAYLLFGISNMVAFVLSGLGWGNDPVHVLYPAPGAAFPRRLLLPGAKFG